VVVRNDADAAGELAEQAAEKIAAACWILGSRLRAREPGHLAAMTRDAVNGYQTRRRREGAPSVPAGLSSPSSARETFRLDGRDLRL
jgi:hypothetical protein